MTKKDINIIANEIHRPAIKNFIRRKVVVNNIDEIWAVDIVDMQKFDDDNDGYKYILTVIDCFSKFAWAVPLKSKTTHTTLEAIKKIIHDSGRKPEKIWSDAGREFVSKEVKEWLKVNNIELYHTYSENKSSIIERFNRTLKTNMWKLFTENQDHEYITILPKLLKHYNNSIHRTINMTPTQASKKSNENSLRSRYAELIYDKNAKHKPKFNVGDKVRISKVKGTFEKGYEPNWSYEVFKISKVIHSIPVTYNLVDLEGEPITGSFYEQELQKTSKENVYIVEDKIKSRMKNGEKEWFVKWYGFAEKYNSWVKEKDMSKE
jgi:hypothetical protein